ncbi:MAG: hypothetical protein ACXWUI_16615 [Burkholderiales bacterium]
MAASARDATSERASAALEGIPDVVSRYGVCFGKPLLIMRLGPMARAEFTDWDVWSFKKNEQGKWAWQRQSPDGELLMESRGSFEELPQCQDDATRFGYVLPQAV